jgi:hippurate hydrolase
MPPRLFPLLLALLTCVTRDALANPPIEAVTQRFRTEEASLHQLYRHLHQNPELSWQELETAKRFAAELKTIGAQVSTGVGTNGVVAILRNGPGPVVLLRCDLDALPLVEETGLPYASTRRVAAPGGGTTGVMHACGHDLHMTAAIGVARILSSLTNLWKGTVIVIGQPAEEIGSGARAMLRDGLYRRFPKPDFALSLHCHAGLPAGTVGVVEGFVLANVDSIDIRLRGVGGHGAYPETTRDPIVLAAQSILALQTIRSREISALDAVVVTVGSIHGGSKHNIIPDDVALQLTVRSYREDVRQHTLDSIRRIVRGQAIAAGIPDDRMPEVRLKDEFTPALYNDPTLTRRLAAALARWLPSDRIQTVRPAMGGEDFSEFGRTEEKVPLFDLWVGTVPASTNPAKAPSLHSSQFSPDLQPTLETAVMALTAELLELLPPNP